MGYYTWFSMKARHIKSKEEYEAIVEALKDNELYAYDDKYGVFCESDYSETFKEATFSVCDEYKWYDHTYDMMKISKLFPDVIFRLSGDGEEREDMWHEYFHNGQVEECRAEIKFPKPTEIEWNDE